MKQACIAVNHFLRDCFPNQTWTSIAVLYNPSMPLHRDILNMIGHANHATPEGLCVEAVFFSPFQPLFRSPQTWMRQIAAVASRHCCNFTDLPRTKYEAVCLPVSQAFAGVSTS